MSKVGFFGFILQVKDFFRRYDSKNNYILDAEYVSITE